MYDDDDTQERLNDRMWSNMWSRYGHIAFRVLLRLDPPVLGPSGP